MYLLIMVVPRSCTLATVQNFMYISGFVFLRVHKMGHIQITSQNSKPLIFRQTLTRSIVCVGVCL